MYQDIYQLILFLIYPDTSPPFVSITDGQIFLSMSLANKGILPAIDITQSVSRVGSKAQYNAMKDIMKKVKRDYALYRNYEAFSKIGNGVDGAIKGYVTRGLQYMFLFKQRLYETHTFYRQVISLFAVSNGYLESVDLANIQFFFSIFFSGNFADQYLSNKEHIIYFVEDETLESLLIINSLECIESDLHEIFKEYQHFFITEVQPRLVNQQ